MACTWCYLHCRCIVDKCDSDTFIRMNLFINFHLLEVLKY